MLYTIENEMSSGMSSGSSSDSSSPRLHTRRNALAHVLQGCTVSDLETIYKCTTDISKAIAPIPSPSKDTDEGSPPPVAGRRRMKERRNAVSFDRVTLLLASGAVMSRDSEDDSASCHTT